ncbi:MAG TPA: hypothetical protein QF468_02595 [Nitrospinota bacterium]|jgi:hypothetical protein|nr:hypothetical protein [Nitrospinota bacterium]|tara:strand:- start:2553 stop:3401 length:849 start_codon:yes stop_codon:yes gene_type:complete
MFKSGLSFILTHIDVEGDLPLEIIPGYFFRKAKDNEIKSIKEYLNEYPTYPLKNFGIPYEAIIKEVRNEGSTSYQREALPPDKWKYWVLAFEGSNSLIRDLQYAAILLPHDLDFAFEIFFKESHQQGEPFAYSFIPLHLRDKYSSFDEVNSNAAKVKVDELIKIKEYYNLRQNLSSNFIFVDHAIKNFFSLRNIPEKSELLTIGYFSIIEALITHKPRLTETLDSISHQLRNKIILLMKRFSRTIQYNKFFLNAKEDKIWRTLYNYRSCLAHGSIPNFEAEF